MRKERRSRVVLHPAIVEEKGIHIRYCGEKKKPASIGIVERGRRRRKGGNADQKGKRGTHQNCLAMPGRDFFLKAVDNSTFGNERKKKGWKRGRFGRHQEGGGS